MSHPATVIVHGRPGLRMFAGFSGLGYGYQPGADYSGVTQPGYGVTLCPPGAVWDGESCVVPGPEITVTGSASCPAGYRKAPNGQCITVQSSGGSGGSFLDALSNLFSGSRLSPAQVQQEIAVPTRNPVPWGMVAVGVLALGAVGYIAWRK
jgi:hypothetical protein